MEDVMRLKKGRHLSPKRAEKIIQSAGIILEKTGIKVSRKEYLEKLKVQEGISVKGDRAYISLKIYEDFLTSQKLDKTSLWKHGSRLHGEASLYTYRYRDPMDGKIKEYTMESLAQIARFVEKARKFYPLNPVIPGYPSDVPASLSSLARYLLAAENCSGSWPAAPDSPLAAEYMFEMTGVMGQKMVHLPVYMVSPLTLGGDSLDIVVNNSSRLESFYTFSMPNMGVTTPMNISMGLAVVLAEVAGGAILVEKLTGLRGEIRPNLLPFDFKYFNIAFGSPEKFLYEQASVELLAYIKDEEPDYSSANIHTWGKAPDGRTGLEKGMMIMAGALAGARRFYCIGTQSLDEVFDPLQMLQDLEGIVFAQRILDGLDADEVEDTLLEEMEEGITAGFVSSDRSLDDYATYLASPDFSPKDNLQKWIQDGEKSSVEILKEIYDKIDCTESTYVLEKEKQQELRKIFDRAMKAVGK